MIARGSISVARDGAEVGLLKITPSDAPTLRQAGRNGTEVSLCQFHSCGEGALRDTYKGSDGRQLAFDLVVPNDLHLVGLLRLV